MRYIQKKMIEHMVYPLMETLKGNKVRSILYDLQCSSQNMQWHAVQQDRIRHLLRHCADTVPYYHFLRKHATEIDENPMRVLTEYIAPVSKQEFQLKSTQFLSAGIPITERIPNCTGGSTGEPVQFFMTRTQVENYEAARWRGLSWYGITPGSRSVMIWGNPVELSANQQNAYKRREALLKNRLLISAYDLAQSHIEEHLSLIKRYRPEYMYGYSSAIVMLAHMIKAGDLAVKCRLKAVVCTSETLFEDDYHLLKEVFRCPIVREYGARDAGILAYACPENKLHMSAENCIIEVLNPQSLQPVSQGESGVLAITDLCNFIQPRLRYLLGDVGALAPHANGAHNCTQSLPVLQSLSGRVDALIKQKDGSIVHGHFINHALRAYREIKAFQFIQHSTTEATLNVVSDVKKEVFQEQVLEILHKTLPYIHIEIKNVEVLPRAISGKFHYVIREFDL